MNKTAKIEQLFSDLHRQYPLWPSTFSNCSCGRGLARGNGKCGQCLEESLAELIGSGMAKEIHTSIASLHMLKAAALDDEPDQVESKQHRYAGQFHD